MYLLMNQRVSVRLAFGIALLTLSATPSWAAEVSCSTGGDAAGWTNATGMDFDGDGVVDIAVGAPCARIGAERRAGSVSVYSGADGRRLLKLDGSGGNQKLGAALAFTEDISGDGRADLIVGSPGYNAPKPEKGFRLTAGKVEVYAFDGSLVLGMEGLWAGGELGEAVAALGDVTGDGIPDFAAGAGQDRLVASGDRLGAVYIFSGTDGSIVDMSGGEFRFDEWGRVLGRAGDVDDDGVDDLMVGSNLADLPGNPPSGPSRPNHGIVRILSGADLSQVIVEVSGEHIDDKLGRSVAMVGDMDGDGDPDFFAGAPGTDPGTRAKAGTVELFSLTGERLLVIAEPKPEPTAGFGGAVASVGLVNEDDKIDIVASASTAKVGTMPEAGHAYMISGVDGAFLWSLEGSLPGMRLGQSLVGGPDWNGDGVNDVVVGIPGDAPGGRRGAGTARVVSGADGSTLQEFRGRRGLETRIFTIGWRAGGGPQARSLAASGRQRGLRKDVFRRLRSGQLSIAVLDDVNNPDPGLMRVAVSTGRDADDQSIMVLHAGRKGKVISDFDASFSGPYDGGVNISAGDLDDEAGDDIAAVQADSDDGTVEAVVYHRFDTDPLGRVGWASSVRFHAFEPDTVVASFPVNAEGADLAVGDVLELEPEEPVEGSGGPVPEPEPFVDRDEIVVGPTAGAPVVRVFSNTGEVQAEWVAFPPGANSGVSLAIGDLNGDGINEIVVHPNVGLSRLKVFNGDGTPFRDPDTGLPVDVFQFFDQGQQNFALTVADVDLDGKGEILMSPMGSANVFAYELDGTSVEGWPDPKPTGPAGARGLALAATERFLRH